MAKNALLLSWGGAIALVLQLPKKHADFAACRSGDKRLVMRLDEIVLTADCLNLLSVKDSLGRSWIYRANEPLQSRGSLK